MYVCVCVRREKENKICQMEKWQVLGNITGNDEI